MTCKYFDKSPDRKVKCLLEARVCRQWLKRHEDSLEPIEDTEVFCEDARDDFKPDII